MTQTCTVEDEETAWLDDTCLTNIRAWSEAISKDSKSVVDTWQHIPAGNRNPLYSDILLFYFRPCLVVEC